MSLARAAVIARHGRAAFAPAGIVSAAELLAVRPNDRQVARASRAARGLALAVAVLGAVGAAGHVFGVERLERWDGRYPGMVPSTAVAFVLCGAALWLLATPVVRASSRRAAAGLAGTVVAWALLSGAEGATPREPRVDFLLAIGMREMTHPGRPATFAVIGLGMLAAALVALSRSRTRGTWLVPGLTWGSALVVIFSLTAWLAHVEAVRGSSPAAGLAPQTALGMALLAAGVLLAQPDRPPASWFIGPSVGAMLARRALPGAIAVPVVTAAAGLAAHTFGWNDPAAGIALTTALTLGVLTAAVGVTGQRIGAVDAQRRLADAIVAGTHDAIVGLSCDGTIVSWNAAAEALFERAAHDVLGTAFLELLPEAGRRKQHGRLVRALNGHGVTNVDARGLRGDGESFDMSLTVSPIADAHGSHVAASVIARDVTERKRGEQELERQRRALRDERDFTAAIFKTAGALVFVMDPVGRIERFNAACEQASGLTAAAVVGRPLLDIVIAPEDREAVRGTLLAASDGAFAPELECEWVARDGSRRLIQWSNAQLLGPEGQPEHTVCVGTDVTARRRAECALAAADRHLRQLFEQGPIGIALVGRDGRWVNANPALCRLLGYSEDALQLQTVADVTHPDDVETTWAALDLVAREPDGKHRRRKRYVRANGETVAVQVTSCAWRSHNGNVMGAVAHVEDVSAREHAEERFHQLFDAAPIAMARLDTDERLVEVNPAFCQLVGYSADRLPGLPHRTVLHPEDASSDHGSAVPARVHGDGELTVEAEQRYVHASGRVIWSASTKTLLRDEDGQTTGTIVQVLDITEHRQHVRDLQHLADHDPLTGLLNRRAFNIELDRQLVRGKRYGAKGALVLLDLDHFKYVNDTLGHGAGDQLIISVADVLRSRLRESDIVARLGGDEFAVLLPQGDVDEVRAVARTIVEQIRDSTCLLDGQRYHVTASVGVAALDEAARDLTAEDLLISADVAMYEAKEAGRDRAHLYERGRARSKARLTRIEQIRRALKDDAFILHAQPIFHVRDGTVNCYELLVRLRGDDGSALLPASWLAVAERFDLIQPIDRWVTRSAIRLLADHHAAGEDVGLSVNLSGKSIGDAQLLALIRDEFARAPQVDPSKLIFEITETTAVADIRRARDFAQQVGALGCRFALDDFGAGFGSFFYLKHLPFDYVKIDGEFVEHCVTNQMDRLVVESLVSIARGLGKEIIAEFVTDEQTLDYLRDIGVDYVQGHHIGAAEHFAPGALANRTAPRSVRASRVGSAGGAHAARL